MEDSKDKLELMGPIWTLQDRLVPRELLDGGGKPSRPHRNWMFRTSLDGEQLLELFGM